MPQEGSSRAGADTSSWRSQSLLIRQVLGSPGQHLDTLFRLMRQQNEPTIYLCGERVDNEYCFASKDLALLLSVLPQDATKSATPGYHPASTEVYVVLQGSLLMELLLDGDYRTQPCAQYAVLVIPAGVCHRVHHARHTDATSLVAKTAPQHNPKVVRCSACTRYKHAEECPMWASWSREQEA